jgi:hypothetical protein
LACTIFSPIFTVCFINLKKVVKQQGVGEVSNQSINPPGIFSSARMYAHSARQETPAWVTYHMVHRKESRIKMRQDKNFSLALRFLEAGVLFLLGQGNAGSLEDTVTRCTHWIESGT